MRVFLDMDGVLADFSAGLLSKGITHPKSERLLQGFVDKSDWTKDELLYDNQIKEVMKEPGFFYNLPVMPGAHLLWAVAGKPTVLTARPVNNETAARVCSEKHKWIQDNLGIVEYDRFICCLRSEKRKYALEESKPMIGTAFLPDKFRNILVDDLEWNCSEWEKAGGKAILFKTMEQAVNDLRELIG